jgi:subtilisin family serine protease
MTTRATWSRFALGLAMGAALGWPLAPALAADVDLAPAAAPAQVATAPRQLLVMLRSAPAHARVDGGYGAAGYGDAARAAAQARVGARLAAAHGLTVVTLWAMPSLGMDCVVLALPPQAGMEASIAALQAHAEVAWAQPMNEFHAQGHGDPLYALQPVATQWHLDDLHAVATGRSVHVAIIDSGVDDTHPDLAQAVQARANFVDGQAWVAELHGTAVAGLVAARADNGIGMVGIAPDAQLLALRACWEVSASQTLCNSLSLAKALNFAIERRADVINMSLSGPTDLLLGRLIDVALARRQQVVAAVDPRAPGGGFPAAHPGVIAVADAQSDTPLGGPAGAWSAPARDLPTTAPGGGWRMVSGTSFAAGEVSGLLAVMDQAQAEGAGRLPASALQFVRLPGGGIDACGSLLRAAQAPPSHATLAPGCRAVLATTGASPGRSP